MTKTDAQTLIDRIRDQTYLASPDLPGIPALLDQAHGLIREFGLRPTPYPLHPKDAYLTQLSATLDLWRRWLSTEQGQQATIDSAVVGDADFHTNIDLWEGRVR